MRLLDLFCGAGGASVGYSRAGFQITGVDIKRQPRYPFEFVQADALDFLASYGRDFDVIHASPPCQRYSACANIPGRSRDNYPDLIEATRTLLDEVGRPWVIENVQGAPIRGVMLCGTMFSLLVYRHRIFESSVILLAPHHHPHRVVIKKPGRTHLIRSYTSEPGKFVTVAGSMFSRAAGSVAMGIDWMTRAELAESIPPAYTEYIGRQLRRALA